MFFKLWTLAPRTWILSGLRSCRVLSPILLPPFQGSLFPEPAKSGIWTQLYHIAAAEESESVKVGASSQKESSEEGLTWI